MSGVEVTAAVMVQSDCEIRSVVDPRTAEVEFTFTYDASQDSTLILGFSRRSFAQFMAHWPHLKATYDNAVTNPVP